MYDHIVVPIDLDQSKSNLKSVNTATQIARDYSATLHFLTVVPPLGAWVSVFFPEGFHHDATEAAQKALHQFTDQANLEGLIIHHIIAHGTIYDQILTMSKKVKADLIVMGSHSPELGDYLLGANAARVVRHANCSVMVVRE